VALLCGLIVFRDRRRQFFDVPALQAFKRLTFRVSAETGYHDHAHLTFGTTPAARF
jgi:hypothetical protein